MAHIDYYTFTLSPFAYLADDRLEQIAEKHGATISYKPIALMKVFEETGTPPPPKRHPNVAAYRLQELKRIAKHTSIDINIHPAHWPTNAAPSCNAIIAAQAAGGGDVGGLVRSLLRACWAEEKDISQDDVVKACLTENGFDESLLETGMQNSGAEFQANTTEALASGVFGVPAYIVGDEVFWGQDRLDYLDKHLATLS